MSDSSNPLLDKSHVPKFQQIKPDHVIPAIEFDLNNLRSEFKDFEHLLSNPQEGESWGQNRNEYDYSMVIEKLEKIQAPLAYSWSVVGHLMGVKNSDELR